MLESKGSMMNSFVNDLCLLLFKNWRTSTEGTPLRLNILITLEKLTQHCGSSFNENLCKDVYKMAKQTMSDKCNAYKEVAVKILLAMVLHCPNSSQLYLKEEIPILVKYFDNASYLFRKNLAAYIATMIAGSQVPMSKVLIEKPKKSNKLGIQGAGKSNTTVSKDALPSIPPLSEVLEVLSASYSKPLSSQDSLSGIIATYICLFTKLGTTFIEANYSEIVKHLLTKLVPGQSFTPATPFEALAARQRCRRIFQDITQNILSEQGQIHAVKTLGDIMTEWVHQTAKADKAGSQISTWGIICAVDEVGHLIEVLGDAAGMVQDSVLDPLMMLLDHHGYSIQISASWSLRTFCISFPSVITNLMHRFTTWLNAKFISSEANQTSIIRQGVGYGYALGALLSATAINSHSVSDDFGSLIYTLSSEILNKNASFQSLNSTDPIVFQFYSSQVQVGWTLMSGLMCLGPNFVRLYLPQIMLHFHAFIQKIPTEFNFRKVSSQMEALESVQSHEGALQALYLLISYNQNLITTSKIHKQIVKLLIQSSQFIEDCQVTISNFGERELSLVNIKKFCENVHMIRKRIMQCFSILPFAVSDDSLAPLLTKLSINTITHSSQKESLVAWTDEDIVTDWIKWLGTGFSMTSCFHRRNIGLSNWCPDPTKLFDKSIIPFDSSSKLDSYILDLLILNPTFAAKEYDPISLFMWQANCDQRDGKFISLCSTVSSLSDVAASLFGLVFPNLSSSAQSSALESLLKSLKEKPEKLQEDSRPLVNALFALLSALKTIDQHSGKQIDQKVPKFNGDKAITIAEELVQLGLTSSHPEIAELSANCISLLCKHSNKSIATRQVKFYLDKILAESDSIVRSSSLLCISQIYNSVGSQLSATNISSILNVLFSLFQDPHPLVHLNAIQTLTSICNSTGFSFSSYISQSLQRLFQLLVSNSHLPNSKGYVNHGNYNHFVLKQNCGKALNTIISILGPDVATQSTVYVSIKTIMEELFNDPEELVAIEYLKCIQLMIMFNFNQLDIPRIVSYLCIKMHSLEDQLQRIAANCLYQLVQKDASAVLTYSGTGLISRLFFLLDQQPHLEEVVAVLKVLISHSKETEYSQWFKVLHTVLVKHDVTNIGSIINNAIESNDLDEEFGSLNINKDSEAKTPPDSTLGEFFNHQGCSRWQTQLVALQIMNQFITIDSANKQNSFLIPRFGDLIKLSFSAATASIDQIRLEGYLLLHRLILEYHTVPVPQMTDMMIIDEYQPQITAALAPAINGEFSAEVTSKAIEVAATYLIKGSFEIKSAGRLIKLLVSSLEHIINKQPSHTTTSTFNESDKFNAYSTIPVILAVQSAWCRIILHTTSKANFSSIYSPHLESLSTVFYSTLKNFAYLKLDPSLVSLMDQVDESGDTNLTSGLDFTHSLSNRSWILNEYSKHWILILKATSYLIDTDHTEFIKPLAPTHPEPCGQPTNLFWIVFGLCVENLSFHSNSHNINSPQTSLACLSSLKSIFIPSIAGQYFLENSIFFELLQIFERYKLTNNSKIILEIVLVLNQIVNSYGKEYLYSDSESDIQSLDQDKGYQVYSFYVGILSSIIPGINSSKEATLGKSSDEDVLNIIYHIGEALEAITCMATKESFYVISLHLFTFILLDPRFESLGLKIIKPLKSILTKSNPTTAKEFMVKSLKNYFTKIQPANLDINVARQCIMAATVSLLALSQETLDKELVNQYIGCLSHCIMHPNHTVASNGLQCARLLVNRLHDNNVDLAEISQKICKITLFRISSQIKSKEANTGAIDEFLSEGLITLRMIYEHEPDIHSILFKLILEVFLKLSQPDQSSIIEIAAKHPAEFRSAVQSLSSENQQKLKSVIQNTTNSEDSFDEDEDDFSDDDDNYTSSYTAQPQSTIQLKESFL
jgi:dethiobiotin synthetase